MSDTYTKLFSSITESTVWGEPYATRIVWVTLLAMADARGDAYGSTPGLARRANVTLAEVDAALESFRQPDPRSRTQDYEGRRIEDIDGGWHLLNHDKYAAIRSEAERREYKRDWDRENRPSGYARQSDKVRQSPSNPTAPTPPALALTLEEQKLSDSANATSVGKPKVSPCPYGEIIELFHQTLPTLPRVREITEERKAKIKARWNNGLHGLDRWKNYFEAVSNRDFLMGRCDPGYGRSKPFVADIDFLIRKSTVVKIAEGKYLG